MNKYTYKLNACWCCSLTFIRVVAPKGAVCTVFVSSNIHRRILFSNSSFKRFNFTLLEQLNTNLHGISLHSSAKLFAMVPLACHLNMYHSATCEKIPGYSRVLARQMANCFAIFCDFHCKFIHQIVKLLFGVKFFPCCGFPNILINMVSPNSWIESKFIHFAKLQFA